MNKKQRQLVETTRAKVQQLQRDQDTLYADMVRQLGITDDPTAGSDFLWDYVFNCDDNTNHEYLQMVKENVFGNAEAIHGEKGATK